MKSLALVLVALVACETKRATGDPPRAAASSSSGGASASAQSWPGPGPSGGPSAAVVEVSLDAAAGARAFVTSLGAGDFDGAFAMLEPRAATTFPAEKLRALWEGETEKLGKVVSIGAPKLGVAGEKRTADLVATMEKGTLAVHTVFDAAGKIVGLQLAPALPYDPPAYVDGSKLTREDALVGSGKLALGATLAIPKGAGPFPALVLVHGSGGGDRDESGGVGTARPFRDLAEGLATRGIVVLRYDKRTHGANFLALGIPVEKLTIKEEYTDDVAAALALLASRPEVDKKRIFILGHSLGGHLAPKLAEMHPEVAGVVLLAGNARPFVDLVVPQYEYLAKTKSWNPLAQAAVDDMKARVAKVKDPKLSESTPAAELPFGGAPAYWLSLRGYDAPATAKATKKPYLVLQGGRDYQVTTVDFDLWKKALGAAAEGHLYPKLNHAFIAGEGMATPEEYLRDGHVDPQPVEDIAAFIAKH